MLDAIILTVDSPLCSTIVLFETRPFPWVSGGFLERLGSQDSEWKWKVPLES